jgi:hypothetical protein
MQESDFFLIVLVSARHLDYTQAASFLHTIAKHPSDGSKSRDVGHAWIYLQGRVNQQIIRIEGGHSGEIEHPRYFDGVMNYNEWGYARVPQKCLPRFEPNPIKYLWVARRDGFFQKGNGGHQPTFAAKIDLTEQQFHAMMHFIHHYPYPTYSLTQAQCSSFVTRIAALANWHLTSHVLMRLPSKLYFGGCWIRFWQDPRYSTITFATPDVLEKSLMQAVDEGRAEYALDWYRKYKD